MDIMNTNLIPDETIPDNIYNDEENYQPPSSFMESNQFAQMPEDIGNSFLDIEKQAKQMLSSRKRKYDFKTKNKSFLDVYQDLYKMGIKNNKFHLRIYDTSLIGIDPYSPMLPFDVQLKIILECMINPWYWLREVCRVPVDGMPIEPGGGSEFLLDRTSIASWYCFLNGIAHYNSKPRQRGKTQDCIAKINYTYHFGAISSTMLFFNKDFDLAKTNLYRFKCQRDMLPVYMQMRVVYRDDGKLDREQNNITTMRNPVNGNTIRAMPKATSKDGAMKLGRGETAAVLYCDEFDFMPFNVEILNAAVFAFARASQSAKDNGSLYGRIFSSTPGDGNSRDAKTANKYISRMLRWKESFFDDPVNKLAATITSPAYNGVMYIEHSWQELKLPISWYEEMCNAVDYNEEVILREINLQRIAGNGMSPFKRADLIYITNHKRIPLKEIDYSKNYCPVVFYEEIHRSYPYILANDPSEGLSQDNNAFSLINPYTLKVAAEFKSPYISQPDMAKLVVKFMDENCPRSMIVVENNRGREMINCLRETKYRHQIWYDQDKLSQKPIDIRDKYGEAKRAAAERRAWGLTTTGAVRPQLFAILENLMVENKDLVDTDYIVKDILGLIRKPSGRIEAGGANEGSQDDDGNHDDNVMSYLMGLFVYYNASNLEEFGIVRGARAPISDDYKKDPRYIKENIKSKMGMLPDQIQEIFQEVLQETDPVDSAWQYQREVQRQLDATNFRRSSMEAERDSTDHAYDPDYQDALWNQMDRDIIESNFRDTTVDLDKFLD